MSGMICFLLDGALGEVDYDIALLGGCGWTSGVGVVDGLAISNGLIEQSIFDNKVS
jgi:hypothetical protein